MRADSSGKMPLRYKCENEGLPLWRKSLVLL